MTCLGELFCVVELTLLNLVNGALEFLELPVTLQRALNGDISPLTVTKGLITLDLVHEHVHILKKVLLSHHLCVHR